MSITTITSKRFFFPGLFIIGLIILAILPNFTAPYFVVFMSTILLFVVLTVSWALFSGPSHYISLASAAFFGIGVYTSAILGRVLPLPLVIGIAALASFSLALLVGVVTLRLKGIYFAMFTFGLVELVKNFLHWYELNISNTVGRIVVNVDNTIVYYIMLLIFALTMFMTYGIKHSKYGLALQSIGQNEEAAAHIGVNVTRVKVIIFAISAIFVGATGAIMATQWTYIDPSIAFNPLYSFLPVVMASFGGMAALYGPVLGATIFTLLEEYLGTQYPYHFMLILGITLIVVILYLPDGLVGLLRKLRHTLNLAFQGRKVWFGRKEVDSA